MKKCSLILNFIFLVNSLSLESKDIINNRFLKCCQYVGTSIDKHTNFDNNEIKLVNCVNNTVFDIYQQFQLNKKIYGPTLSILILTRATSSIYEYSAYSYFIQAIYSSIHHYTLVPIFEDTKDEDYIYHRKLSTILYYLQRKDLLFDYIVWMDAGKYTYIFIIYL